MDHRAVRSWVDQYERLWRTPETDHLVDLFVADAIYLPSPWARPVEGLDEIAKFWEAERDGPDEEIAKFWEAERDGPDEEFTMTCEVVAVDGDTAVVRVSVEYAAAGAGPWRDLWVLRFAPDGRCASFEEWPFAPNQTDGH